MMYDHVQCWHLVCVWRCEQACWSRLAFRVQTLTTLIVEWESLFTVTCVQGEDMCGWREELHPIVHSMEVERVEDNRVEQWNELGGNKRGTWTTHKGGCGDMMKRTPFKSLRASILTLTSLNPEVITEIKSTREKWAREMSGGTCIIYFFSSVLWGLGEESLPPLVYTEVATHYRKRYQARLGLHGLGSSGLRLWCVETLLSIV